MCSSKLDIVRDELTDTILPQLEETEALLLELTKAVDAAEKAFIRVENNRARVETLLGYINSER